jgi:hypothetical protein
MARLDRTEISARLRRLPRQLLLALINATAILVIVAAALTLVVMSRIDNFGGNIAETMSEAVLSKIDLPGKEVLKNLRNLTTEVRSLGDSLREIRAAEDPLIRGEIVRLRETLTALRSSVDRLANARSVLTDEAIVQLGRTVTDTLQKLRDCPSAAGQNTPRHTLRNKLVRSSAPQDFQSLATMPEALYGGARSGICHCRTPAVTDQTCGISHSAGL